MNSKMGPIHLGIVSLRSWLTRLTTSLFDAIIIFLATSALIWPLYHARYLAFWGSIESTFIADARFLSAHWPHPQWQPLWYTGRRFDYIYPPALRYGTALVSMISGCRPARAYHLYTAFFYCAGIVGVYFLIRTGSGSRGAAWLGATAAALMSPSFLFLNAIRQDSWMLAPQRLGALVKYGEGPHITSVALLPFALAFAWWALDQRKETGLALASVFCAAVVSHNFYGATALAMFYPILVWSLWVTRKKAGLLWRAAAIPALAYGLTAIWLTPSYFKITMANMKLVAAPGNAWSMWVGLAVMLAFALASFQWAKGRADRAWPVFAGGSVIFFSLNVLGNYYVHFRISGEPLRLVPELDLALICGALLVLAWLWKRPGYLGRAASVAIVVAAFATSADYLSHAWSMFPVTPNYRERVEYRISEWLSNHMPDARTFAIGSVRFWFDTWHDLAQLGGGSEQGLLNTAIEAPQWEVTQGGDPATAVLWLQCLGVDAVYVSDKSSQEVYKDFANPAKFAGVLPVLYDDRQGNTIYGVPRRYAPRVRVVDSMRLNAALAPRFNGDLDRLRSYAQVVEHGPDSPAALARDGPEAVRLHATLAPGQSILVQESYDPAWQAWSGGRRLSVHPDALGFMAIDAPAGVQNVALVFTTPIENRMGQAISLLSILAVVALFAIGARKRQTRSAGQSPLSRYR
jgi:hypothetical protein